MALVAVHDTPSAQDVDAAAARVATYYMTGKGGREPIAPISLREAVDRFLAWVGLPQGLDVSA